MTERNSNIEGIFNLTSMQEGMLFHYILDKLSMNYILQYTIDCVDDEEGIIFALDMLVKKFPILKSSIVYEKISQPKQVVIKDRKIEYSSCELKKGTREEQEVEKNKIIRAELERKFDLQKDSLIRAKYLKASAIGNTLILTFHHILLDGWSFSILQRELLKNYIERNENYEVGNLEGYKKYLTYVNKENKNRSIDYWNKYLESYEEVTAIKPIFDNTNYNDNAFKAERFVISKKCASILMYVCKQYKITLSNVFEMSWGVTLKQFIGTDDVIYGRVTSGRDIPLKNIENMIGMFINTIPARINFEKNKTVLDHLKHIHNESVESLKYQFCSLADLKKHDLIQSIMVFSNFDDGKSEYDSFKVNCIQEETNYDFTISISFHTDRIELKLIYNSHKYTKIFAKKLVESIVRILNVIPESLNLNVNEICLISDEESNRIQMEFNDTDIQLCTDKSIIQLFEDQVENNQEEIAIIEGAKSITYAELNQKSNQLARMLRKIGIKPNDFVVLYLERSIEMMIGIYGIIKAGAAYVPVSPEYPEERIKYIINDCKPKVILVSQTNIISDIPLIYLDDESIYSGEAGNLIPVNSMEDAVYCIYTSGTTGKPKGVVNSHKGILNRLDWMIRYYEINSKDTMLQKTIFTFDVSVWEIFMWGIVGGKLALLANKGEMDPAIICSEIEKNNISRIHFVPSMLNAFLTYLNSSPIQVQKLNSLKTVFCSGEALNPESVNGFYKVFQHSGINVKLANLYGPTEAAIDVTYYDCEEGQSIIPIGKPISNIRIYIMNHGRLCGIGMTGELCISGIGVAKGYMNKPQLTAEKFIQNPFGDGKLYKTGDLARWLPDGNIEYLGRVDEQVKIRGFRIELGEITSSLKKIACVKDCAVVVKQDQNGDKFICAYIVSDLQIDLDAIKNELGRSMPEYMMPAYIQQIDFIPVTSNGKLNRRELPEIQLSSECQYEEPRNKNEKSVCEIFELILNREQVGIKDNFFKLGGHSLKSILLINRIGAKLGVSLEVQDVFRYPTPEQLCERIFNKNHTSYEPIPSAKEQAFYSMSSSQKRIYLVCQMDKNSTAYNMPQLIELKGVIDTSKIENAIQTIVNRHEIFRTEFIDIDGELVQRIRTHIDIKIAYEERRDVDSSVLIREFTSPFDLECAPLLRCKIVKHEDNQHFLIIDTHHIVSDGISLVLFWKEFSDLYNGKQIEKVKCQFKDYSEWMNSRDLNEQKDYWIKQFSDDVPVLDIPYDFKRPRSKSFAGNTVKFELDSTLSERIQKLAQKTESTEYMVFLAITMVLLSKYSCQQDIVIGSPVSSRTHKDTEKILGMFVNTLPMRGQPKAEKSFETFLGEIKESCIKAYENQEYPLEELIENIDVVRDMSRTPLFDVMLAFQNNDKIQIQLDGIQVKCIELLDDTSKFDMTFNVEKINKQYWVEIRYCTDLFRQETIEILGQYFVEIICQITENCKRILKEIQLNNEEDQNKILNIFNQTYVEYPKEKTMKELFEKRVEQTPDNVAVIYENKGITYKELNEKANQLARRLRIIGIAKNDYVVIFVERSIEMIIAVYGVIKAGGAYVPISTGYPKKRIEYIFNDCKPKAVITNGTGIETDLPTVDLLHSDIYTSDSHNLNNVNTKNDYMYCTYTSGSTGTPKGIPVRYRSLVNLANWYMREFNIAEDTKNVIIAPLSFDLCMRNIFGLHMGGGTVCLCGSEHIFDANRVDEFIKENNISLINCAASAFYALLFADQENNYNRLKSLKNIYLVGEILSFQKIKDYMSSENCNAHIVNGYGPTEDSGISTTYWVSAADEKRPSIPVGKPLYNKRIYILDGENLCGIGVKGEICICGAGVTDGYLNLPQLTEKKFVKDPFGQGMMFRTGDLGRWLSDGNIEFLGRLDELAKIRGYRVELGEIEAVIKKIESVKDCAVIVRGNKDAENEIYAYIVSEQEINISKMRNTLSEKLPEYMIPAYIAQINKIPVTSNGKLDYRSLPDIEAGTGKEYVAPTRKVEKILCDIYQRVLKSERVGVNDNFFELGGHSLKVLKVIHEIEREFGVRVDVKDLFSLPTVAGLSEKVQQLGEDEYIQIPKAMQKTYYPMSSTQKRVYIINQINGDALAYNMPHVIKLKGNVDQNKVKDAFQTMINQHEILRTEFISKDGTLVQRIRDEVSVDFTYIDLEVDELTCIQQFIQPFQLDHAPLFRVQLVRRDGFYLFLFDIHHIITDGVSMGIMFQQFSKLYNGEVIRELPYQYKDYSEWMNGRDLSNQKEFWEKQFGNQIPILDLPLDYERPKEKSFQGAAIELTIQEDLYNAIDSLCKNTQTTQYMVFLSAVMILLSKYSGQDDIVVGNGISGRVHKDTEDMLGMFVNTLAMRGNPAKEKSYLKFLNEIKNMCLDAYSNQEYPFEELVNDINVERDLSRNPLFDVMLVLQNMEEQSIDLKGVEFEYYDYKKVATKFDLTFKIFTETNLYHVVLEYATDLFSKETAIRWNTEFVNILKQITKCPQKMIHDVQAEIEEEQKSIIEELNQTDAYYPEEKTIVDLFEEQVTRTPDRVAVRYDEQIIIYDELNQKANQLARKLRSIGVKPNDFVVILAKRSIEMLIAVYGILKAGGAYVPISSSYPKERIRFMMEDCQPKAVLCYQVEMDSEYPVIDLSDEKTWKGESSNLEKVNIPEDRLYCTYTSGTTGTPKGVPVRHRSEVNLITWYKEEFEITQETRNTIIAPLSFDLPQRNIFGIHTSGGMLCLHGDEEAYDAIKFAEFIQQYHITMLNCAASAFYALLFADQKNAYRNLQSLKKIYLVGEALSFEKLSPFMESPYYHADILNGYGATEDSGVASVYTVTKADSRRPSIPIGKPLNNKQMYVMDGERICGIGMRGEICICGVGVTEGYLNQPELTKEKFVKNPFGSGIMYRTGDLGRWLLDGNLEFLGRMDEQVKVRGYRIELGEIENSLRKIEYIKDTAVIAKEDSNHETAVFAYLVSDLIINMSEIRERLLKILPEYMVPAYIGQIDSIPVTSNGKLDRRALPDIQIHGEEEYVPPENTIEETLCRIYEDVLKVDRVGVNDGFFEMGGHSLKVLKMINRIEEELGVHISVKEIFTSPTVKGLARMIQSMTYTVYQPIPVAEEKECYPMSSTQKRTYIVCQIDDNGTAYHMPYIMSLKGIVDAVRIEEVVQDIVNRHEILRTEFITRSGEMLQRIVKNVKADYSYFEDTVSSEEELIQKFIKPFDFEKAPLFRACLVKREQEFLLMFDTHHIISDGMSMENFLREFTALYNNEQLKPLSRQYKDYSEWMRNRDLSTQKEYWVHEFEEEIPILNLPLDYARPKEQSFRGTITEHKVDKKLWNEIKFFARQQDVTEYMVFLSAAMILLSKYSRQEDIVIGSPISGRTHKDTESMLGMFVNTLAMRGRPEGKKIYKEFLKEIKESCFKAYENQEYPFEELVEEIKVPRDLSRNPLFDVMLVLQNNEKTNFYLNGTEVSKIPNMKDEVKFDLTFKIFEETGSYEIVLEYCTDLFQKSTAEWMMQHYITILKQVIENKELRLDEINLISEEEQKLMIEKFNQSTVDYGSDRLVLDLFEEQVRKTPDRIAVIDGNKKVTYRELNEKSNQLARHLIERGVQTEDFVAILSQRSTEIILAIYGTLKAGAAYIPINPEDPQDRIQYILKDCNPKAVLIYGSDILQEYPCLDLSDSTIFTGDNSNFTRMIGPDNLAYCIYTSGTTGKPKGVLIEHRNLYNYIMYAKSNYCSEKGCAPFFSNVAFDLTVTTIFALLVNGSSIKVYRDDVNVDEMLLDTDLTILKMTPSHLKIALGTSQDKKVNYLECMILGGEGLSVQDAIETLRIYGTKIKIHNEYGPTETTVGCCDYIFDPEYDKAVNVKIGKPIANTKIYIMNGDQLCGIGVPGEICIAGAGVGRGYHNLATQTNERFIKSPDGSERMYRSGDLGRWLPDGNIECMGRIDSQVKIRGFRVELGEIENVIKKIESVKDVAVIVRDNSRGDKAIYAYLVCDDKVDRQEIIRKIKNELPDYMIPSYIGQIEKIPITSNGKLNQRELPDIQIQNNQVYEPPKSENEAILCNLFEEVLGVESVGRNNNFYELGGDSIKAIRIVSKVRDYGYKISVRDILSRVTIQAIAIYMTRINDKSYDQSEVNGDIVNTPIVDDFINREYENIAHYNQAKMIKIDKYEGRQIRTAIDSVILHHDILRSVFMDNHLVTLSFAESKRYDYYDIEINSSEYYDEVENECNKIQQSFNLTEGPLVKIARVSINGEIYLFICIHHLLIDGVSWRILIEDIYSALEQVAKNLKVVLPDKMVSYQEWAARLNEYKNSKEIQEQIPYWKSIIDQKSDSLIKPDMKEIDDFNDISIKFDQNTTEMLLYKSSNAYHTELNDILLTALGRTFFEWKGQEKLMVMLEGHGREEINGALDIDRTIGWFTITYPVILDYKEVLADNIIQTKEMLRRIPDKGIGYGLMEHNRRIRDCILFNFMGEMDAENNQLFDKDIPIGYCSSPLNKPAYLLEMNGVIKHKELCFTITYNKGAFSEQSMQLFSRMYKKNLSDILKYCITQKDNVYTESDWSTDDLETDDYMKILGLLD